MGKDAAGGWAGSTVTSSNTENSSDEPSFCSRRACLICRPMSRGAPAARSRNSPAEAAMRAEFLTKAAPASAKPDMIRAQDKTSRDSFNRAGSKGTYSIPNY